MNGIFVAIKVIVATFASRGKFACAVGHDRLKSLFASSGRDDGPPVFGKCLRHGCSDSAAAAGDDGDSLHLGWHGVSSVELHGVDKVAHELCVLKLRRVGCDQVVVANE